MIHSRLQKTVLHCKGFSRSLGRLFDQVVKVPCGCWIAVGSQISTPVSSTGCDGTTSSTPMYVPPGLLLKGVTPDQVRQIRTAILKSDPFLDIRSTNLVIDTKRALTGYSD